MALPYHLFVISTQVPTEVRKFCKLDETGDSLVRAAMSQMNASAPQIPNGMMTERGPLWKSPAMAAPSWSPESAFILPDVMVDNTEEFVARDPLLNAYRQNLDTMDVQISELAKLGPDHPVIKQSKDKREALTRKYDDLRAEQASKYRAAYLDRLGMKDHGVHPDVPKNVSKSITVD